MNDNPQPPRVDGEQFLQGGDMGVLMRAKDWSTTPLGPLDGWPQSLRTAVSVMLAAPQPSYIFWGRELAILYNDLGLPFVGQKHPECLGQTIREVLKEAWPVLGPLVEGVMESGVPVFLENLLIPLNRVGFLQDGYFTFSYVPTRNEAAEVGGILVIVNETTGQVVGARRLALIRELSLRAALCQTVVAVLQSAEQVLAQASIDLPFALVYEMTGTRAQLVVSAGLERGLAASPVEVVSGGDGGWPLFEVAQDKKERLLDGLDTRFTDLPGGASGEPPRRALVLPLAGDAEGAVTHVLVAGLNPRYLFDDEARSFLQLVGRQIVTSVASTRAPTRRRRARAEALAELDRAKTAFFSNVSHEFRTPLTLMLGPVEDALRRTAAARRSDALASVHRNALRLLKLVNTLLDFARIEAGRVARLVSPDRSRRADGRSGERLSLGHRARRPAAHDIDCAAADRAASTSIATCGRRSSSTSCRTRSSSRFAGEIAVDAERRDEQRRAVRLATPACGIPGGRAAAPVRALSSRRGRALAHARRQRHRPRARARAGASCTAAPSSVREPRRRGLDLHRHDSGAARRIWRRRSQRVARARRPSPANRARVRRRGAALAAGRSRVTAPDVTDECRRRRPPHAAWRASSSPTTTPTCATTSRACSRALDGARPSPTAGRRSAGAGASRPTSSSPT